MRYRRPNGGSHGVRPRTCQCHSAGLPEYPSCGHGVVERQVTTHSQTAFNPLCYFAARAKPSRISIDCDTSRNRVGPKRGLARKTGRRRKRGRHLEAEEKLTSWLPNRSISPESVPLFCFPYAGGGTALYHAWRLAPPIQVMPVQLPGREARFSESPFEDSSTLVDATVNALDKSVRPPFALFGHSMGGRIALEVARRCTVSGRPPLALFVSACPSPERKMQPESQPIFELPDEEMIEALIRRYGEQVSETELSLMRFMANTIRADLMVFDSFRNDCKAPVLTCPLFVLGGADDPQVSRADLAGWSRQTTGKCTTRIFSGKHFYLRRQEGPLRSFIQKKLIGLLPPDPED